MMLNYQRNSKMVDFPTLYNGVYGWNGFFGLHLWLWVCNVDSSHPPLAAELNSMEDKFLSLWYFLFHLCKTHSSLWYTYMHIHILLSLQPITSCFLLFCFNFVPCRTDLVSWCYLRVIFSIRFLIKPCFSMLFIMNSRSIYFHSAWLGLCYSRYAWGIGKVPGLTNCQT